MENNDINVYLFWLGNVDMTSERKECYKHIIDNCPFIINEITDSNLNDYILKDFPLHEGYQYLSNVHKFDYIINYFSNYYGGIFIGIKKTYNWDIWKTYFDKLHNNNNLWICSSHGNGPSGITQHVSSGDFSIYKKNWQKVYGHIGWICKKNTLLTNDILNENHTVLNKYLLELKKYPAKYSRDSLQNSKSNYKIPWAILGGGSMYHGILKYSDHIDNSMPQDLVDIDSHCRNSVDLLKTP